MHSLISRRNFMAASGAASLVAPAFAANGSFPRVLGAELYTVRSLMPAKDEEVLRSLAQIGYKEVEGDYPTFKRIAPLAKQLNLKLSACHIPIPLVMGGETPVPMDQVFSDLKALGTQWAVLPYVNKQDRTPEILGALGAKMTKTAEAAAQRGLKFAYHNHAFEFAEDSGKRVWDRMFANTNAQRVYIEADVFWLTTAGVDPVKFLNDHKGRVKLLHVKDRVKGAEPQYNEDVSHETFKEAGSGNLDWPAIFKAAHAVGVEHYFVEQDWTPGDPVASLRKSYEFLSAKQS